MVMWFVSSNALVACFMKERPNLQYCFSLHLTVLQVLVRINSNKAKQTETLQFLISHNSICYNGYVCAWCLHSFSTWGSRGPHKWLHALLTLSLLPCKLQIRNTFCVAWYLERLSDRFDIIWNQYFHTEIKTDLQSNRNKYPLVEHSVKSGCTHLSGCGLSLLPLSVGDSHKNIHWLQTVGKRGICAKHARVAFHKLQDIQPDTCP